MRIIVCLSVVIYFLVPNAFAVDFDNFDDDFDLLDSYFGLLDDDPVIEEDVTIDDTVEEVTSSTSTNTEIVEDNTPIVEVGVEVVEEDDPVVEEDVTIVDTVEETIPSMTTNTEAIEDNTSIAETSTEVVEDKTDVVDIILPTKAITDTIENSIENAEDNSTTTDEGFDSQDIYIDTFEGQDNEISHTSEILPGEESLLRIIASEQAVVSGGEYSSCSVINKILDWDDNSFYASKFIDIEESFYKDDIAKIEGVQIISGRTATTFDPFEPLTRAEFLAVALKAHCINVHQPASHGFIDVEKSGWKSRVIGKAVAQGIVSGETNATGQKIFRPNDPVTRMEVVAILLKLSKQDIPWDRESPYSDIASQQWQKNYVTRWNELGLFMPGKTHNKFYPNRPINREHIGTILFEYVELYR